MSIVCKYVNNLQLLSFKQYITMYIKKIFFFGLHCVLSHILRRRGYSVETPLFMFRPIRDMRVKWWKSMLFFTRFFALFLAKRENKDSPFAHNGDQTHSQTLRYCDTMESNSIKKHVSIPAVSLSCPGESGAARGERCGRRGRAGAGRARGSAPLLRVGAGSLWDDVDQLRFGPVVWIGFYLCNTL